MNHSPPVGLDAGYCFGRKTIRMIIGVDRLWEFIHSTESDREEPAAPCCWCFRVELKQKYTCVYYLFIHPLRTVNLHLQSKGPFLYHSETVLLVDTSLTVSGKIPTGIATDFLKWNQMGFPYGMFFCIAVVLFNLQKNIQSIPHYCVLVPPPCIFNLPLCLDSKTDCLPFSQAEFGRHPQALLGEHCWTSMTKRLVMLGCRLEGRRRQRHQVADSLRSLRELPSVPG
jgi:hypothetical protein